MGGAVKLVSRTPAEGTVLLLQQAARGGSPMVIPGAWNARGVPAAVRVMQDAAPHSTFAAPTSVLSDRERLERELEGGGAPRERAPQRASVLTRSHLTNDWQPKP